MNSKKSQSATQDGFSSSFGFLCAAVAAAVGLSNILRFSSETYQNGGGIYVCLYLVCIFLIGYPVVLAEIALGRSKQKGLYESYEGYGRWKWVGVLNVRVLFSIFCFYNVIAGWVLGYLWKAINGSLFEFEYAKVEDFTAIYSELKSNWGQNFLYTLIMVLAAVFINHAGVSGGIEKTAKVLIPCFVLIMLGLVVYAGSLPGAAYGLDQYLVPRSSNFTTSSFAKALTQAFMSLSAGMGAMIAYGAYVNKQDNLKASASIIVGGDTLIALIAGLFLFSFLGNLHEEGEIVLETGKKNSLSGFGLAFITLPILFAKLGTLGPILAIAFFLLLLFAAITSSVSLLEGPTKYLESRFGMERKKTIWLLAIASYLLSGIFILGDSNIEWIKSNITWDVHQLFQDIALGILAPLSAFFFVLFIAYKWKVKNVLKEIEGEKKKSRFFTTYLKITLEYIAPLLILISLGCSIYELAGGNL